MKILYSPHFARSYRKAPDAIQQAFDKQLLLLLQNPHPSLHAKKYDESADIWLGPGNRFMALLLQDRGRHLPAGRDQSPPQEVGHERGTTRQLASSAKGLRRPPSPRTTRPTMAAAVALSRTRRNRPMRSEVSSERNPMAGGPTRKPR